MRTYLHYKVDSSDRKITIHTANNPLYTMLFKYHEFLTPSEYKELKEELTYNTQFKESFHDAICNISSFIDSEIINDTKTQQDEIYILENLLNEDPKVQKMKVVLINNLKEFCNIDSYFSYVKQRIYFKALENDIENNLTNAERKLQIILSKIILQDSLPISLSKPSRLKI